MLERIIPYMATIRTLDLSGCSNITAQTIAALVASCPNLETVRVCFNVLMFCYYYYYSLVC